jgi:uncharacterized protein (UPF0332 family)
VTKTLPDVQLLRISKGSAEVLNHIRLGVHITTISDATIEQLIENAARDRYRFAQQFLRSAARALGDKKPQHRLAVSRAYYAMNHAARALVYFVERGDDHEAHSELPKHLPKDFPNRADWENEIKNTRLERNRADYDPYPKSDRAFADSAGSINDAARRFLVVTRRYLTRKGCKI